MNFSTYYLVGKLWIAPFLLIHKYAAADAYYIDSLIVFPQICIHAKAAVYQSPAAVVSIIGIF